MYGVVLADWYSVCNTVALPVMLMLWRHGEPERRHGRSGAEKCEQDTRRETGLQYTVRYIILYALWSVHTVSCAGGVGPVWGQTVSLYSSTLRMLNLGTTLRFVCGG